MKRIWIMMIVFCFSSITFATEKAQPIKHLTFLINQIEDGDEFYKELFSGFEKFKQEGHLQTLEIINYDNNQDKLDREFHKALQKSDAIVLTLLSVEKGKTFAELTAKKNMPLILAFRKPSERFLFTYPNVFYISQDNTQSGVSQGLLISQYLEKNPSADTNHDKEISLLNIGGSLSGSEKTRLSWKLNTINNYPGNVFRAKEILRFKGEYNYDKVFNYMKDLLDDDHHIRELEIIVTQSDNMAKGVTDALKNTRYSDLPIFARGLTSESRQYIANGRIKGTILSPPSLVGYYACQLSYNYINKLDMNHHIPYLIYKKKIEIPYSIVTKENLNEY